MEKVRPWCGQASDRGRLKNRTEQNRTPAQFSWPRDDLNVLRVFWQNNINYIIAVQWQLSAGADEPALSAACCIRYEVDDQCDKLTVDSRKCCQLSRPPTVQFITMWTFTSCVELSWQHTATIDFPWRRNFESRVYDKILEESTVIP